MLANLTFAGFVHHREKRTRTRFIGAQSGLPGRASDLVDQAA